MVRFQQCIQSSLQLYGTTSHNGCVNFPLSFETTISYLNLCMCLLCLQTCLCCQLRKRWSESQSPWHFSSIRCQMDSLWIEFLFSFLSARSVQSESLNIINMNLLKFIRKKIQNLITWPLIASNYF